MGSIAPHIPSKAGRARSRDTGFPDNFCGIGNTSLPHPDAKIGADACITSDDIDVHKTLNRHRRSFLIKHKRALSYGTILPSADRMYSDLAVHPEMDGLDEIALSNSRSSKDGTDSLGRTEGSVAGGDSRSSSPISPVSSSSMTGRGGSNLQQVPSARQERQKSLLRRFMNR